MANPENPLPLPPTSGPDNRPHIYVINANEAFLELIGDILRDARLHVTLEQMRPNPEVTLGNLRSAQPDLIILDVIPYTDDAAQLLERMKNDPDLATIPVMVASTSTNAAERIATAYTPPVCEILSKPFELDELYIKLSRIVAGIRAP
jgi:CheY-like chemotaxis protein